MPQEFQVLRCYQCSTFQVHQVKKAKKWSCKMCGEKQSVIKVFGRGTGAECRHHVQKLNSLRGEIEQVGLETEPSEEQVPQTGNGEDSVPSVDRWSRFVTSDQEEEDVAADDQDDDRFTTDITEYRERQRTRKRKRNVRHEDYEEESSEQPQFNYRRNQGHARRRPPYGDNGPEGSYISVGNREDADQSDINPYIQHQGNNSSQGRYQSTSFINSAQVYNRGQRQRSRLDGYENEGRQYFCYNHDQKEDLFECQSDSSAGIGHGNCQDIKDVQPLNRVQDHYQVLTESQGRQQFQTGGQGQIKSQDHQQILTGCQSLNRGQGHQQVETGGQSLNRGQANQQVETEGQSLNRGQGHQQVETGGQSSNKGQGYHLVVTKDKSLNRGQNHHQGMKKNQILSKWSKYQEESDSGEETSTITDQSEKESMSENPQNDFNPDQKKSVGDVVCVQRNRENIGSVLGSCLKLGKPKDFQENTCSLTEHLMNTNGMQIQSRSEMSLVLNEDRKSTNFGRECNDCSAKGDNFNKTRGDNSNTLISLEENSSNSDCIVDSENVKNDQPVTCGSEGVLNPYNTEHKSREGQLNKNRLNVLNSEQRIDYPGDTRIPLTQKSTPFQSMFVTDDITDEDLMI